MFTLRCTQKLLKRLGAPVDPEPPPSTTQLGDWIATYVINGRRHLVVALSARTYLPVIVPARELKSLPARLADAAAAQLALVGVPDDEVAREGDAMREVTIAKTNDRRAVGVLGDFVKMITWPHGEPRTLDEEMRFLARSPVLVNTRNPLWPDVATRAVYGLPPPKRPPL